MKDLPLDHLKYREVFLRADPMGIYFEDLKNVDEYDPEITLLLTKLGEHKSREEIHTIILQIFVSKFGPLPESCKEKLYLMSETLFELQTKD